MKLASWVYWPVEETDRRSWRRRVLDGVQAAGLDIALCVWRVEEVLEHAAAVERLGDELAEHGTELHVGIAPFAPPARGPRGRRYQFHQDGRLVLGNLCPSWPANRERVARHVEALCRRVRFTGLHLDFIRYLFHSGVPWQLEWEAGREWIDTYPWCECEACRAARQPWLGRGGPTAYDRQHPGLLFKELEHRKRSVDEVLRRIREITGRHARALSIAQRVQYLNRAVIEGQDWLEWAEAGLYDFTCPMNYTTSTAVFRERLQENVPRLAGRQNVKVYEGVSRRSSAGESSIYTVLEQMDAALALGADGICLFHLGALQPGEAERLGAWKKERSGG